GGREGLAHAHHLAALAGEYVGDARHQSVNRAATHSGRAWNPCGSAHDRGRPAYHHVVSADRRGPTVRTIARRFEADLGASILARGPHLPNVRQISERVAMGRALWRELVVGFASQLGELRLGFTQLAALYVLADGATTTIGELADALGRSPSATSRLVDGLVPPPPLEPP